MEVSGKRRSDVINTGSLCAPCKLNGETENADSYCAECNEDLCIDCVKAHKKVSLTRNHRLSKIDGSQTQQVAFCDYTVCSKHDGKPLEYFCKKDDFLCCSVCLNLEHKQCDVEYITDLVDRFESSGEYDDIQYLIVDVMGRLDELNTKAKHNIGIVNTAHKATLSDVKGFREEINTILDSFESTLTKEATDVKEGDTKSMQDISKSCESRLAELDHLKTQMENQHTLGQMKKRAIYAKQIKRKTNEITDLVNDMSKRNSVVHKTFIRNEHLLKVIQTSLEGLGKLESVRQTDEVYAREGDVRVRKASTTNASRSQNARYLKDINVKHVQDPETCHITGSVVIGPTRIAVADNDNSSVKVVDIHQATIVAYINIPSKPMDITFAHPNQLIVTSYVKNELVFVDVGETLTMSRTAKVDGQCRGIHYADKTIYVSCSFPGAIKIMDIDGRASRSIRTDPYGHAILVNPLYVITHTDNMYVSDNKQSSVTRLDMSGNVRRVHKTKELVDLNGLAVDRDGTVYVAGSTSNNICILSADLEKIVTNLTMDNPLCLAICKDTHTLFVSHGRHSASSKRNALSVYNLV